MEPSFDISEAFLEQLLQSASLFENEESKKRKRESSEAASSSSKKIKF